MFGFGKKKQSMTMPELPPPPSPPGFEAPQGDIPVIQSRSGPDELPEFPAAPSFEHEPEHAVDLPEPPAPDMPEAPAPKNGEEAHDAFEPPQFAERQTYAELQEPEDARAVQPLVEEPAMSAFEPRETLRKPVGPAFVSVDEYRNIMDQSNRVRDKLTESEQFVHRLHEIKAEEEQVFAKWRGQLEDVERKLGHIDRVIAKAKR